MPNLARGISGAAGALAESYGNIEKEKIDQRHRLALEKVKDKYTTKARKDEQIHDLHKQEQASKYRISEYDLERTDKASDRELEYTRGLEATEKKYAHEIEKTKITASGRMAASARSSLTAQVWENLKAVRPDEDENELWLEAFKLTNEKKEMSPEAEVRGVWNTVYAEATSDPLFGKTDEEARSLADQAAESYQNRWFPDMTASRERFKKQGGGPVKSEANPEQSRKDRIRELY